MLCHENQDVDITDMILRTFHISSSFLSGVGMGWVLCLKAILLRLAVLMFDFFLGGEGMCFFIDIFINTFANCTYYQVSAQTADSVFSCHWDAPENTCNKNNPFWRTEYQPCFCNFLITLKHFCVF